MKNSNRRRFLLGAGALALLAASPLRAAAAELELQQPGTLRVAVYANFAPWSSAGKGIAVGLMVLGGLEIFSGALVGGLWLILIGLFLRGTAEAGYQNLVLVQSLADVSVGDVAIADPVGVAPQLSLDDLAEHYFLRHGYRAYPVLDGETPVGIVAVTALRDLDREERAAMTVKDRMTPIDDALCIGPQAPLTDALKQLARTRSGRLLVVHDDRLVGLLTKDAVARFLEIRRVLEPARGEDAGARA